MAVESIVRQAGPAPLLLSFDEIYISSGLQLMLHEDSLIIVGTTCHGTLNIEQDDQTTTEQYVLFDFSSHLSHMYKF